MTDKQLQFVEALEEELEYHRLTTLKLAGELADGTHFARLSDISKEHASLLITALLDIKS